MNRNEEKQSENTLVVSPLANEKTYGERVYSRVVDSGLNYWTNLLASAGFSHWAEHSTKPFKLPFIMNEAASPRDIQQKLAGGIRKHDPFFRNFEKKTLEKMAGQAAETIEEVIHARSMSRARAITLLTPGFAVMIPAVWLGAKVKPWVVEKLNQRHYGTEAMDDPSLKARHQAIEAEARPTLLGTVVARMGTVLAVQATSQIIGSKENLINELGRKVGSKRLQKFPGIDETAGNIGTGLGSSVPDHLKEKFNNFARNKGLTWSLDQQKKGVNIGPYSTASQDLSRFVVLDTIYTLVSAGTIRPFVKLLRNVPGMSYKPKVAENCPELDGDTVKVPKNRYADAVLENAPITTPAEMVTGTKTSSGHLPLSIVNNVRDRSTLASTNEQQIA